MASELRMLPRHPVLWIGGESFSADDRVYRRCVAHAEVIRCGDLASARQMLATENIAPMLIVVQQARSDEVSHDALDRCRRLAPTAGVVIVLGNWCEGETRSGRPLTGAIRLYASHAPAWFEQQWLTLAAGRCPAWGWPSTRAIEDIWLDTFPPHARPRLGLAVVSSSVVWRETLSRWFSSSGYVVHGYDPAETVPVGAAHAVTIWDLGGAKSDREALPIWHRHGVARRTIALATFPRPQDRAALRKWGVVELLGKPVSLDVLEQAVEMALTDG